MKQSISMHVMILSLIGTTIVPYGIGRRWMCIHRTLQAKQKDVAKETNHTSSVLYSSSSSNGDDDDPGRIYSGMCQSLGIDMDQIQNPNVVLSSSTIMKDLLSKIISDPIFHTTTTTSQQPTLLHPPQCVSRGTTTSTFEQERLYCNAMLLNSHFHINTWPQYGVISMDIFSCSASGAGDSLLSLIPTIQELLGIPTTSPTTTKELLLPVAVDSTTTTRWHYKLRGDRSGDGHSVFMNGDMDQFLCSYIDFDLKEMVISIETDYQTIDIYDTIDPRFKTRDDYDKSLQNDGSYHATHPELFRPDRIIYLDGILQSRFYGDAAYHEALVHPALFTHPHPKRVAIIGGGEGATLREVLKHNTIEVVTMIEIDELMVNVSKQYIPEWSDCSMIIGSTPSCFDDPRAEVFYTDAIAWFIQRYVNVDTIDPNLLYDVIIMDALDPESSTEFSNVLYDNDDFMKSLSNALQVDGLLLSQLGESFAYDSPGLHFTPKIIEYEFMENLIGYGFDRMEDYTEAHGGFLAPWKYKILFKCRKCTYTRWHTNQALLDLEMKRRSMKCINDCSLYRFFDSATMMEYQFVSRINEDVFCHDVPYLFPDQKDLWCNNRHGYDPDMTHNQRRQLLPPTTTSTMFEEWNDNSDAVGIIPSWLTNNSYVDLDQATQNIIMLPTTSNLIRQMANASSLSINDSTFRINRWDRWNTIFDGSCSPCHYWGTSCCFMSVRLIMKNANVPHTNTDGRIDHSATDQEEVLQHITSSLGSVVYNPYISRNHFNFQWITDDMMTTV